MDFKKTQFEQQNQEENNHAEKQPEELDKKSKYTGGVDAETGKILYSPEREEADIKKEQERKEIKDLTKLSQETRELISFLVTESNPKKDKEKRREVFNQLVDLYKKTEYKEDITGKKNFRTDKLIEIANLAKGAITQAAYSDFDQEIKSAAIAAFDIIKAKEGLNQQEEYLRDEEIEDYNFNLRWSLNRLSGDDEERWLAALKLSEIFLENKYPPDREEKNYEIDGKKLKLTDKEIVKAELVKLAKDKTNSAANSRALEVLRGVEEKIGAQVSLNKRIKELYTENSYYENELFLTMVEQDYIPFDPEKELKKINQFSEEELKNLTAEEKRKIKKERLDDYKKELKLQKENIVNLQKELFAEIRENPDMNYGDLLDMVIKKAPDCKLNIEQLHGFSSALVEYTKTHSNIKRARKEFPTDKDFFEACFGKKPQGKIQVVEGPMNLHFVCQNPDDYLVIYSGNFYRPSYIPTEEEKKMAESSAGCRVNVSRYPGLEGLITAQKGSPFREDIFKHEERHTINSLFSFVNEKRPTMPTFFDKEETNDMIKSYFRDYRKSVIDIRAKNEFLAYITNEGISLDSIVNVLAEDPAYAFFNRSRSFLENEIKSKFKINENDVEKLMDKVFVEEYHQVLNNAKEAIENLTELGHDRPQILAILSVEPISKWKKVSERLLEEQNPDKFKIKKIREKLQKEKGLIIAKDYLEQIQKEKNELNEQLEELNNRISSEEDKNPLSRLFRSRVSKKWLERQYKERDEMLLKSEWNTRLFNEINKKEQKRLKINPEEFEKNFKQELVLASAKLINSLEQQNIAPNSKIRIYQKNFGVRDGYFDRIDKELGFFWISDKKVGKSGSSGIDVRSVEKIERI